MNESIQIKETVNNIDTFHLLGAITMIVSLMYVLTRYSVTFPVELIILGVALFSYLLLTFSRKDTWIKIRYVDWFITVPLLVYVVSQFGTRPFLLLVLPVILMLGSGFLAVLLPKENYNKFINLGFIFYAIFFLLLVTSQNTLPWPFIWIFFGSWALYGFVDRLEGPNDNWAYTALDIFNKPIFIFILLTLIE